MRSFVLIARTALASADFSLEDLPSSSGRLDVLLRCLRAALLVSNGLRRDVRVYLVLRGGQAAPRVLRVSGESAKFLRPDERSLAILVKKTLAVPTTATRGTFVEVRPGLALCDGDLEEVLSDVGDAPRFVLHEQGRDIRGHAFTSAAATFFIGDQLGFDVVTLERLDALGYERLNIGPVSLHSDDVVSVVSNELDRRVNL